MLPPLCRLPAALPLKEKEKVNAKSLTLCLCYALLAGCAKGAIDSLPAAHDQNDPSPTAKAPNAAFTSLYSFKGNPDGAFPLAPLVQVGGNLYGTTSQGGTANANGDGTIFKITPSGDETVLYSFAGSPDGQFPQAGLIALKGLLYGTTPNGGTSANGTVFTSTKKGAEKVLYSFMGGTDAAGPTAGLLNVNGTLYGTTLAGGGTECNSGIGCGTVFKIDPSGTESVLYRFQGGTDGQAPSGALVFVKGMLYGTTFFGGGSSCNFRGCGTIFKVDPAGTESVIHSFKGGSDGANPDAGLIDLNGRLYGTTSSGGGSKNDGTVFHITTAGKETVIHRFKGRSDGADPESGLLAVKGTLYGTTFAGGQSDFGTVFQMTTKGAETVLHSFTFGADGGNPSASLIRVKGTLYGTTKTGGTAGFGTVYSIAL